MKDCKIGAIINQLDINKLEIPQRFQDFLENQMIFKQVGRPTNDYKVMLEGKERIIKEIRLLTERGEYGLVYILTLDNNSKFLVKLSKQKRRIEEYKLVDQIPRECKNILPIRKFGRGSVMMLYADTNFNNIYIGDRVIRNIIKIIGNSLICLLNSNLYYFDLKLDNILYRCLDGKNIEVFLADLGSMISRKGEYVSTFPPIELMGTPSNYSYNRELYRVTNEEKLPPSNKNGYINISNSSREDIERYYVWLLCILYLQLKALQVPSNYLIGYINRLAFNNNYNNYRSSILFFREDPKIDNNIRRVFSVDKNNRMLMKEFLSLLN